LLNQNGKPPLDSLKKRCYYKGKNGKGERMLSTLSFIFLVLVALACVFMYVICRACENNLANTNLCRLKSNSKPELNSKDIHIRELNNNE